MDVSCLGLYGASWSGVVQGLEVTGPALPRFGELSAPSELAMDNNIPSIHLVVLALWDDQS